MSLSQVYSAATNSVGSSSSSGSSRGTCCKTRYRTVHLKRDLRIPGTTFGFSFRGGREFGTGFFVSVVEHGSEAHLKGVKVGDQIIRINGLSVENATHQEILQLAQHHHHLTLSLKNVGIIPVKDNCEDPLTWRVVDDPLDPSGLSSSCDIDRIVIDAPEGSKLGCGICKGPDWRPGIFIQYTKPNSLARQTGLQPGDQILQCNRVSFVNIDFSYAVSVLKSQGTLDLIVRKGSGIDLFPGESSGYSSASSTADEPVTQTAISKRNCPPPPPPRKEMDHSPPLKTSASVGCLLEELKASGRNRSMDVLNCPPPPLLTFRQECKYGSQTVVQISGGRPGRPMEVQVHQEDASSLDKSSTTSSFSSLSSAISQELQRRKEKQQNRLSNGEQLQESFQPRKAIEGKNKEHDSLIAELKRRQDRRNGTLSVAATEQHAATVESANTQPCNPPPPPPPPPDSPPPCPTPDYSDSSAQHSPQPNHNVKSSILRFEERNRKVFVPKSVTFGTSSTKEITPIKNEPSRLPPAPKSAEHQPIYHQDSGVEVEMQSIDDHELRQPKPVAPKPPPTYFRPPKDLGESPKRTTVIKIMEYPSENSKTPGKLDFIAKNNNNGEDSFDGELARTLNRSNLKGRSENVSVITNGTPKTTEIVNNRNSISNSPLQTYIPFQHINQDELSTVKKTLRTFERNTGVTADKFIIATELLRNVHDYPTTYYPGRADPEIECMELISIFPINLVSLSVFQRHRRKVLRAKFHDGNPSHNFRVVYYELASSERRRMFWRLWCEKIRFLRPENLGEGASCTESSAASSISCGSVYVSKTRVAGDKVWYYYGYQRVEEPKPNEAYSGFLGSKMEATRSAESDEVRTIYRRHPNGDLSDNSAMSEDMAAMIAARHRRTTDVYTTRINRFSEGVQENCVAALYASYSGETKTEYPVENFDKLCEEAVRFWEKDDVRIRPPSLWRFCPFADLNHCLGIYSTDHHGMFNMQKRRRSQSVVHVKPERAFVVEEGHLQKKLKSSMSADTFAGNIVTHQNLPKDTVLCFWTTDYWYKPDKIKKKIMKSTSTTHDSRSSSENGFVRSKLSAIGKRYSRGRGKRDWREMAMVEFKESLKLTGSVSIWDLDRSSLACQLTIIDSQLFLKIPIQEIRMLLKQGNGRKCANFLTWVIFSHRISSLVATQILICDSARNRSRLISRLIMVCENCHRLSNFQSTSSILNGLQSPAIYQLRTSWAIVRKYHSKVYEMFRKLCREYRNLPFLEMRQTSAYLVSASQIVDILVDRSRFTSSPSISGIESSLTAKGSYIDDDRDSRSSYRSLTNHLRSFVRMTPDPPPNTSVDSHPTASDFARSLKTLPSICQSLSNLSVAEEVLRSSQQAVRKYELCGNLRAKEFLLKQPYHEQYLNFELSMQVENHDRRVFIEQQQQKRVSGLERRDSTE